MKINLRAKNIKLTDDLRVFVDKKIGSLDKLLESFKGKDPDDISTHPRVEARVEIEKTTHHHRKGPFFRAECQLWLQGKDLRAEAKNEDLRQAIVEVKDELQREIKKYKGKMSSKTKRSRRFLKKLLKLAKGARFRRKKGGRDRNEGI